MQYSKGMLAIIAVVGSPFMGLEVQGENTQVVEAGQVLVSGSDLMLKNLSIMIKNYKAEPTSELTDQNVSDLTAFASDSLGASYNQLSREDWSCLSQIINLNAGRFPPSLVVKFNADQKLAARMSTEDIQSLKNIIVDIRDGKRLTPRQVSDVKDFKTMISRNPYAFIPELYVLTQYVSLNPKLFTESDLDVFRQASRDASGITSSDMNLLKAIAGRSSSNLNRDDIAVLKSLSVRGPIGSLNGLDPQVVIVLHATLNENSSSFPADSVSSFNRAFDDNQAVQFYIAHSKGNEKLRKPKFEPSPTSAGQR